MATIDELDYDPLYRDKLEGADDELTANAPPPGRR